MEQTKLIFLIAIMSILSGAGDAYGFTHAANIWQNGKFIWSELGKSALGFGIGVGIYWIEIKYLKELGVVSPEVQTLLWFSTTLIGVALLSGKFFHWAKIDQVVAILVLIGIGWLLFRTSN